MNEYLTLTKRADGKLELGLTVEGAVEAHDQMAGGMQSDDAILGDLLEHDLCNGWWFGTADEVGCLSNAPVLADEWECGRDGLPEVFVGHWWYWSQYQVRSVLSVLLRDGKAVLSPGI